MSGPVYLGRPGQPPFRAGGVGDGSGDLTVTIRSRGGQIWRVRQISAAAETAPGSATGVMRVNDRFHALFVPQGGTIVEPPPVDIGSGDEITITWGGLNPGDVATVDAYYDVIG